jgi:hypothetical protein
MEENSYEYESPKPSDYFDQSKKVREQERKLRGEKYPEEPAREKPKNRDYDTMKDTTDMIAWTTLFISSSYN